MSHTLPHTTAEIEAVYARGSAAVVDLVQDLLAQVDRQQQTIADLAAQVQQLQERLDRNSHNSHQPPSTDGFHRPPRSLRQSSGKKPGGQPGHPGHTLRFSDAPDRIVIHRQGARESRAQGEGR